MIEPTRRQLLTVAGILALAPSVALSGATQPRYAFASMDELVRLIVDATGAACGHVEPMSCYGQLGIGIAMPGQRAAVIRFPNWMVGPDPLNLDDEGKSRWASIMIDMFQNGAVPGLLCSPTASAAFGQSWYASNPQHIWRMMRQRNA